MPSAVEVAGKCVHPFGSMLPNRWGSTGSYRYGFQGQEKDDEVKGEGNSINFTFRMHDPRVGRFFAVDPLTRKYPHYTPYSFAGNKVIQYVELEGLEEGITPYKFDPYDYGVSQDQIWDRIVDGASNIFLGGLTIFTGDETEAYWIRRVLNEQMKVNLPTEISDEQLAKHFNVKKRNRRYVVEPQKGVLSELLDYSLSALDVAGAYPGKNGVFMAIKTTPLTTASISKIIRSLKVSARTNEILRDISFIDLDTGKSIRRFEAEGIAIFEETFETTARAITNLDNKAGDFIVTSGKYANKSVDLVTSAGGLNFKLEDFIKSVDKHYLKDGVDIINIDIRSLDGEAKKLVKEHVSSMSEANQLRTIITE